MDGGGGSRARYIDSHLETHILTQKDISDWDIVMDGGRDRHIISHIKTHILTQKHISDWDIVMDGGGGSRARYIDSHLETHILTQKDISWELSWTVVGGRLSVSIPTF
jgi:hypothetical protein